MEKPIPRSKTLLLFAALLFSKAVFAEHVEPFLSRDQNPLVAIYGLPLPVSGRILNEDQSRFTSSLNISNTINAQISGNETLFVDIESYQLDLLYDYGLNKNWMLRFQLPVISHSGGFLDAWIENYHDVMHLPEDIRPDYPRDQLDIDYQVNGLQVLGFNQPETSIGDVSVQAGYQHSAKKGFALSYWASIKLPTGDSQKLSGSEGTDLAAWVAADYLIGDNSWLYGNFGGLYMQDSELLPEQHKNTALFANAGMQFHPWEPVRLKAQLDIHSAFYDSSLELLGNVIQLTFGGTILFENRSSLDIAVAEDIQSGSSPDVNFIFSWRINY